MATKALVQRQQAVSHSQECCLSDCIFLYFSFERQESVSTTEARLRMEGMEFKEEWQDEDFPR